MENSLTPAKKKEARRFGILLTGRGTHFLSVVAQGADVCSDGRRV